MIVGDPKRKLTVWRVVIAVCLCGLMLFWSAGNRVIFHVPYVIWTAYMNIILFSIAGVFLFKVRWFRSLGFCLFYVSFMSLLEFLGITLEIVIENKLLPIIIKYGVSHAYGIYLLILSLCLLLIAGLIL